MVDLDSNAKAIFYEALDRVSDGKLSAYLEEACGHDAELRRKVDDLLEAHRDAGNFLGGLSPPGTTIEHSPIAERPGTIIGAYKLLQQIGEGAFGVVFVADQERPVKRRVALKVIKPGMDTREVVARFEAERQALAMMDHPNIAKVYDAGATENGRPYFVMELVQGVPFTDYCDKCNLTTDERLMLFILVCQAVQHAHQKGVIHRDIKPSNVLVAVQDGQPSPKIIDFGVAKAINHQLTELTLMTAFAQIIGTPLYMSPEQAELSPLGVDTRSDIYSLGVLLYELLTGTTPFDKNRLQAASYDELRRIIREEEPARPSLRISTLAADRAVTVAEHRRTDLRRLRQTVRGELDWIVMKCLEKDRNRRYESAGSLARDVERFLHDEPVQACPPSAAYRFRKFAHRNKALLGAGGAIAAVLIVGLGLSTWQYFRATTESARANAVSGLMRTMLNSANIDQAKGSRYTVRELLDHFSEGLGNQLADQPAAAADIHDTIGGAYSSLNFQDKALVHLEKAIELRQQADGPDHENVADALVSYSWTLEDLKRYDDAETHLQRALEIYRRRGVTGVPVVRALSALQKVLLTTGRNDEAKRVMDQATAIVNSTGQGYYDVAIMLMRFGNLKNGQGEFVEAEQLARRSIEMQRAHPGNFTLAGAHGLLTLSRALQLQRKFDEAEEAARESIAIFRRRYGTDHNTVRRAREQLKSILASRGDKQALESLAKTETEEESRSDNPGFLLRLATSLLTNRPRDGATNDVLHQLTQRAIEEYGQVATVFPDDLDRRMKAVDGYVKVAQLCAADPEFAQEIDEAHRRLTVELEQLAAAFQSSTHGQEKIGHRYRLWAFAVRQNSDYSPQVESAYRAAIEQFEKVLRDNPKQAGIKHFLVETYALLGDILQRSARPEEADAAFQRVIEIYDDEPVMDDDIFLVVSNQASITSLLLTAGQEQLARAILEKATAHSLRLPPSSASANPLYHLALAQLRLGDQAGYRATCKALVEIPVDVLEGDTKSRPAWTPCLGPDALDDPSLPVKLAEELVASNSLSEPHFALYVLGAAYYRAGQYEQAAQRLEQSIAAFPSNSAPVTDSMNYHRLLFAMTQWRLDEQDRARRLLAETLPDIDKELNSSESTWNRRATLELLRAEAISLIGQSETGEAANKEGQTQDRREQDKSDSTVPVHPDP